MKARLRNASSFVAALIKLIRWPNLLMIFCTQYLVFAFIVSKHTGSIDRLPPAPFFLLSCGTVLIAAAGYIINDYYDIKIDLVNKPDRIVIGQSISRRQALFLHAIFNGTAIFFGLLLSWRVAVFFSACTFWLWIYSNYLKRTPLLGNLLVTLLTSATIWVIGIYFHENDGLIFAYCVFAFLISLLREVIKDMEDTKGDAVYGCRTLPIVWGFRKTKGFLFGIIIVFIGLLGYYFITKSNGWRIMPLFVLIGALVYLGYKLWWADKQKHYADLSAFCKGIMVLGLVSLGCM